MNLSSKFLSFSFVAGDQVIESILFSGVFGFKISHFFTIFVSQFANLINQRIDLLIFKGQLSIKNFKLSIFRLNGSMEIM
jgi:hypothetical protein